MKYKILFSQQTLVQSSHIACQKNHLSVKNTAFGGKIKLARIKPKQEVTDPILLTKAITRFV